MLELSICTRLFMEQMANKNKILKGDYMNRFLSWFYEYETSKLVNRINEYAERHGLKIISISTNENQHGAIVLFEGNKPRYDW